MLLLVLFFFLVELHKSKFSNLQIWASSTCSPTHTDCVCHYFYFNVTFCCFNRYIYSYRSAFQIGFYLKVAPVRVSKKCGIQLLMPLGLLIVTISVLVACLPYLHCSPQKLRLPSFECWRVHQMFTWVVLSGSTSQTEGEGKILIWEYCPDDYMNFFLEIRISFIAQTGSILGGDVEGFFMKNLLMEVYMLQDFPCQRWLSLLFWSFYYLGYHSFKWRAQNKFAELSCFFFFPETMLIKYLRYDA